MEALEYGHETLLGSCGQDERIGRGSLMLEFYKTGGGRRFCDSTVPELTRQLKRLADEMHRANILKEMELRSIGAVSATTPGEVAKEFIRIDPIDPAAENLFVTKILQSIEAEGGSIVVRGSDYEMLRNTNVRGLLMGAGIEIDVDDESFEATLTKKEEG